MGARSPQVNNIPVRALALLRWIQGYQAKNGYMPTIREMAGAFRMKSNNGPRYYLNILEQRGYVIRAGGLARTLRVTEAGERAGL